MLFRILIAVEPRSLERRIARLAAGPDRLVATVGVEEGELRGPLEAQGHDMVLLATDDPAERLDELAAKLTARTDGPAVIVLSGSEDAVRRAALLAAGCAAVLNHGLPDRTLATTMTALVERHRESLVARLRLEARGVTDRLADFASESPAMRETLRLARKAAAADSSLFLLGETGVGKEWLVRAIHEASPRARGPLVAVNCAALPETLLESELFGHERGAFTGAERARRGSFELAHRGTLFLDEVAEMSPHLQAKLLRALQERRFQRLGGEETIAVDLRIIAATSLDLDHALARGAFRKELYYRLAVVTLDIPPLRERREDVPALFHRYLEHFRVKLKRPSLTVEASVLEALVRYPWPGNVRELINVVERAVLLVEDGEVTLRELPEVMWPAELRGGDRPGDRSSPWLGVPLPEGWLERPLTELRREVVESIERSYLEAQLTRSGGRIGEAARRARIDPRALYEKMRALGLRKEDFRYPPQAPGVGGGGRR